MPRKTIFYIATLTVVVLYGQQAAGESPLWQASGRSSEGRLLEYLEIAGGADRVMIVAGFRGTKIASTQVAESLARFASEQGASTERATLLFVRDANPDGRARHTPTNARGVDLDRNFASSDWRKIPIGPQWLGGRQPASEPETRWMTQLIEAWRPSRIVVLLSDGRQGWIRTVGADPSWRDRMAAQTNLPWVDSSLPLPSGSLASWAAIDRKIPTLLVNLPGDDDALKFWESHRQLLAGIIDGPLQKSSTIAQLPRDDDMLQTTFKPNRRLVDVRWPRPDKNTELVHRDAVGAPLDRTISIRSTVPPIAAGPMTRDRVYRLPPAEHTISRSAPPVRRGPSREFGQRYPTLQHRPIPIWNAPNGR